MFRLFAIPILFSITACEGSKGSFGGGQKLYRADPTIYRDKEKYYLYGTGKANGFEVYTSSDLKLWKNEGMALSMGESFGSKGFWAPQVFKYRTKYYMAYTANEQIAIAEAATPVGPFRQSFIGPLASPVRMIDPFVFFDEGKIYLYHVRLQEGNKIYVAEMENDLSALKPETLSLCIEAGPGWEDSKQVPWKVVEGPTVIKHKETFYLLYSANDFRNPDYAVGYATAPTPTGPWTKFEGNPILSKNDARINGTGHGDVFIDKKGRMQYVFHTHNSDTAVAPRRTAMVGLRFKKSNAGAEKIEIVKNTFSFLQVSK